MNPPVMSVNDILKRLPHRYPFLLIDQVLELEAGVRILGLKNVSINEPFFQGHFPEKPIMPGVLILEALAQASAVLFSCSFETKVGSEAEGMFLFAGIDNVRFKRMVLPGDQLLLHSQLTRVRRELAKFEVSARIGDQIVCSADILSTYRAVGG